MFTWGYCLACNELFSRADLPLSPSLPLFLSLYYLTRTRLRSWVKTNKMRWLTTKTQKVREMYQQKNTNVQSAVCLCLGLIWYGRGREGVADISLYRHIGHMLTIAGDLCDAWILFKLAAMWVRTHHRALERDTWCGTVLSSGWDAHDWYRRNKRF